MASRACKRPPVVEKATSEMVAIPPKAPHFTLNEWYLTNRARYKFCNDQRQLAEKIINNSTRLIADTEDRVETNKLETDHQMNVKVKDIEFLKGTVEMQKKEMDQEIEIMSSYRDKIIMARKTMSESTIAIVQKCATLREGRLGVDLCSDDVEVELHKELDGLKGLDAIYIRLLEQVNEQLRRLRALNYLLKRDIQDKGNVLRIDTENKDLKLTSMNLATYHGAAPLNPANISLEEWVAKSEETIARAQSELVSGRPLRAYIDTILSQIVEDLGKQYDRVNDAFRRRIEETREAKTKLEQQHFEIVKKVNEMSINVANLGKAVADKEKYMALAHTRLGNRCQRQGMELCKDEVEVYLVNEVMELQDCVTTLQQQLSEAQASLRYLLRTQLQIEEDLNIKTNTLKIDEVDCMTLRKTMSLPKN